MTSFCIQISGSTHHFADAERIAGLLQQAKFEWKETIEDADIVIFNPCSIPEPAASLFLGKMREIKQKHPYKIIIIAGCLPQTPIEELKRFTVLSSGQIHHMVEAVEEALHNNIITLLGIEEAPLLTLPKVRRNPFLEIIPLTRGCATACTFCQIKETPAMLSSYPVSEIVALAGKALTEGVKEFWLTSQDTLGYGLDKGTSLPVLLKELTSLPGTFKIRLSRGNPVHLQKIKAELFPLLSHDKMFRFLHLPLQSGSNRILQSIPNRSTVEEFSRYVDEVRLSVPLITIATNIIVGFPGETEEDHWQTLTLLRTLSPDEAAFSRFHGLLPKSGKGKSKLPPAETVVRRLKVLNDIFTNISTLQNERWRGWQGEIIVEEKISETQWLGRNGSYKPVTVEGNYNLGDILTVKITKAGTAGLWGEIVK